MSDSLWPQELTRFPCSWDFPGKNTGMGFYSLLQGIVPNPGIESRSAHIAGRFFTIWATREAPPQSFMTSSQLNILVKSVKSLFLTGSYSDFPGRCEIRWGHHSSTGTKEEKRMGLGVADWFLRLSSEEALTKLSPNRWICWELAKLKCSLRHVRCWMCLLRSG